MRRRGWGLVGLLGLVLALALAWIVGVYLGSMSLNDVLNGFPTQLFLTLAGVTLLFTQAQLNGTLDRVAHAAVRICRGNTGLIPVMFFVLGSIIASLGPGNVACALSPRCCEARAALSTCSTAHFCRAGGLRRSCSGAKPSKASS